LIVVCDYVVELYISEEDLKDELEKLKLEFWQDLEKTGQ
jgi:hypothetical protein